MKKLAKILLLTTLAFALSVAAVSCNNSDNNTQTPEKINIATLNGTTGFGMAKLMSDAKASETQLNYNIEVQIDPSLIQTSLINGELDIAALPTNAAANLYAKTNGGIKILAVNTLGVLYVVVNEENADIKTLSDLEGKTVFCPAQNPTFIFKGLCEKANVNLKIDNTYAQPADLRTAIVAGQVDIAILPEPMVTIAKSANKSLTVALDLTAEWDKVFPEGSLMQGCVVARTEFIEQYPEAVEKFLSEYEASVNYVNENTSDAAALIAEAGIFENPNVAKAAIPKSNIKYIDGEDMAAALDIFFNTLYNINPKAVGESVPSADIYYRLNDQKNS